MIDAHHHLWHYNDQDYVWMSGEMGSLRHDFLVPDLDAVTRAANIEGTVVVQARQTVQETEWLLETAELSPIILGVVGWVPLISAAVSDDLDRFAGNSRLKAVRHVLHDEPDNFYMLRDDFNRGIAQLENRGLAYDVLIFERQLPQTIEFIDRHPEQVFVIDHVAKPRIQDGVLSPWKENITELAKRDNVYCKISGMVTEADWSAWTVEQLRPYFDVALTAFGPKRLMFGSDWPVLTLASSYRGWTDTFRSFITVLSSDEQDEIFRQTASRVYRF